jgi:serine/threonine-protein kinase
LGTPTNYLLSPGQVLADTYRIERGIGKGGMGEVYEATHARLAGRYAVKLLLREIGQNDEILRRFKQEAEVTSRLRHPNIVQVIDFSRMPDGTPFMVMELLEGRDLAQELRAVGRLPLGRVVSLIDQVASGLAAAHAENIVHRDLKPANIFLAPLRGRTQEVAKIVDFGISKVRALTGGLTRTQAVIGTPQYMAPEQARGILRDIDGRTDQFALGAIAFELLAGRPAFQGDEISSILYQVVHEEPPSLVSMGLPELAPIEAVIRRAMAKVPADRFANVNDFAQAMEAAARAVTAGAGASSVVPANGAVRPPPTPVTAASPGVMPVAKTTLRDSAGELAASEAAASLGTGAAKRGLVLAAVGAAIAVTAVGGLALRSSGKPESSPSPAAATAPAAAPAPAVQPRAEAAGPALITVEIAAAPPALRVQLDGRDVATPLRVARDERQHQLTFSAPGYVTKQQPITASRDLVVEPALEKAAARPPERRAPSRGASRPKRGSYNVVTDI